jgi:hypothetical protein
MNGDDGCKKQQMFLIPQNCMIKIVVCVCLCVCVCGSGTQTQGLALARQALCHLRHSASPMLYYFITIKTIGKNAASLPFPER